MPGEAGFEVARAYVVIEPDAAGFPEKLKRDLESYKFDLKIPVSPDSAGFREKLQADLDASKGEQVTVPVEPDAGGFREKVAAATAGEKPVDVPIDPDMGAFEAKVLAALALMKRDLADSSADLMSQTGLLSEMAVSLGIIQRDMADTSGDLIMQTGLLREMRDLLAEDAGMASVYAAAIANAGRSTADTGRVAQTANQAFRIWGTGMRVGAVALHGLISGMVELAAVAIPATVAAGAWAAVWSEGAQQVQQHMQALMTATSAAGDMFNVTASQALGLGNSLTRAQDAARPQVWQALGGVINTLKGHMGGLSQAGLQVGNVFDNFMAKVVTDFGPGGALGGSVNHLLSHMVSDLTGLGQVLGNTGHALLGFASQMPGLAEVMLRGLAGVTHLAASLVDLSGRFKIFGVSALGAIFALHEFNTWGSVVVSLLGRMGLATTALEGGWGSYFLAGGRFIGILKNLIGVLPAAAFGVANLASKVPVLGAAVVGTTEDINAAKVATMEWIAGMSALETLGVAAVIALGVGFGILVDKILTAKTASQNWSDSLQNTVNKASNLNVFNALGASMAQLSSKTAVLSSATEHFGSLTVTATKNSAAYHDALANASQQMQSMEHQFVVIGTHATDLANKYGTTLPGAMALADMAGVHLNQTLTKQAWAMAQIKIADLVAGYQAMGQPLGAVGADMTALAIQSGLAATKVSALNQAWDQFTQTMTGGTSGLASFEQALSNLTTGSNKVTTILGSTKSVTLSMKDFASSLKSFTGQGAQAWQNFNQVVNTDAPQMIDWLRTAGAEGALSGQNFSHGLSQGTVAAKNFQQAILDMLSQMTPFAKDSGTARNELVGLAQQAGLNIKTFPQLTSAIKDTHASEKNLQDITQSATGKLTNMSQVAQALGNVMPQLTSALNNARVAASGVAQAAEKYTEDLRNNTAGTTAGQAARKALYNDLLFITHSASQASAIMRTYTSNVTGAGSASQSAAGKVQSLAQQLAGLHSKDITVRVNTEEINHVTQVVSRMAGHATGGVIPGYAPGHDTKVIAVSPGEGILVPEAVRGLGPGFVDAANRYFGGPRVTRGNKTGHFASGGITGSARFAYPTDVFNFAITDNIATSDSFPGGFGGFGGGLSGELRSGKTAKAAEQAGQAIAKAFASGTLNTVSAIKAEADKAVSAIRQYYSGPAATRLIATIRAQSASMEKLAAASAKVSATISAMKSYASQEASSLASGFSDLSNIQAPTSASGATQPVTGAYIKSQLQGDLATLRRFFKIIGELKKDALGKTLISQVIALGPVAGIQYGEAILSGGKGLISQLNKIETAIGGEEKLIGQRSAEIQYGQSISKGFLSGLDKQKAELARRMRDLGDEIARELAKALGVPLRDLPKLGGGSGGHHGRPGPIVHRGPHARPGPIVHHGGGARAHPAHEAKKVEVHSTINVHGTKLSAEDLATIRHMIAQAVSVA